MATTKILQNAIIKHKTNAKTTNSGKHHQYKINKNLIIDTEPTVAIPVVILTRWCGYCFDSRTILYFSVRYSLGVSGRRIHQHTK